MNDIRKSLLILLSALLALATNAPAFAAAAPFPVSWQGVRAPLPVGCGWAGQAVVDGKIFVFGGLSRSDSGALTALDTVQIYDPAANSWTRGAAMPTARWLCTAVAVNGKIYVMGGRSADASGGVVLYDKNEVYDPALNAWTAGAGMPVAVRGHMAAAFAGKIVVFGGNASTYQNGVRIYDPATDAWTSGASMSAVRAYGAAVAVPARGRIYIIGGDNGSSTSAQYYGNVLAYDPTGNAWDAGTISMVAGEATSDFGACLADDGKVYVFAGTKWDAATNQDGALSGITQVLDPAAGTLSALSAATPSPASRSEAGAALSGGKIYLIGGASALRLVDVFDPATGAWVEPNAPLPTPLSSAGHLAAISGKLYFLDGGSGARNNAGVFLYDPAAAGWSQVTGAANPAALMGSVADVYNGKIVMADGYAGTAMRASAQAFDPATGAFSALASDPSPSVWAAGGVVGSGLYLFGGYDMTAQKLVATGRSLDLASNAWNAKASLPFPLESAACAAYNGKLYLFGGLTTGPSGASVNPNVLIYDPSQNAFTTGPAMPLPVSGATATVYKSWILIDGGLNWYLAGTPAALATQPSPYVQIYDPASATFFTTPGLYFREYHAAAVVGDTLYVTGGDDGAFTERRLDIAGLVGPSPLGATATADKTSGGAPLTVAFTGTASGGSSPYTYAWSFGDGSADSTLQNPTHVYAAAGSYPLVLRVADAAGATATDSHLTVVVGGVSPPIVNSMVKRTDPFRFVVKGANLQIGIRVEINGAPYSGVRWKSSSKIVLRGSGLKALVPKGVLAHFVFLNPDGGSASYDWSW